MGAGRKGLAILALGAAVACVAVGVIAVPKLLGSDAPAPLGAPPPGPGATAFADAPPIAPPAPVTYDDGRPAAAEVSSVAGKKAARPAPAAAPADGAAARAALSVLETILKNEMSAIGTLRSLTTAEEQFRQQNQCDQDGDGTGEYGWLGELAGTDVVRVLNIKVSVSPFIAPVMGQKDVSGFAQKSGYYFRLFLPTARGVAAGELQVSNPVGIAADADGQENGWACYAWPMEHGVTGNRTFFSSNAGEVYATAAAYRRYSGASSAPNADAAYDRNGTAPGNLDAGVGIAVAGLTACDGNTWVPSGG